jgi:hypothetical protein
MADHITGDVLTCMKDEAAGGVEPKPLGEHLPILWKSWMDLLRDRHDRRQIGG